jgi:hypothetical protein
LIAPCSLAITPVVRGAGGAAAAEEEVAPAAVGKVARPKLRCPLQLLLRPPTQAQTLLPAGEAAVVVALVAVEGQMPAAVNRLLFQPTDLRG